MDQMESGIDIYEPWEHDIDREWSINMNHLNMM